MKKKKSSFGWSARHAPLDRRQLSFSSRPAGRFISQEGRIEGWEGVAHSRSTKGGLALLSRVLAGWRDHPKRCKLLYYFILFILHFVFRFFFDLVCFFILLIDSWSETTAIWVYRLCSKLKKKKQNKNKEKINIKCLVLICLMKRVRFHWAVSLASEVSSKSSKKIYQAMLIKKKEKKWKKEEKNVLKWMTVMS